MTIRQNGAASPERWEAALDQVVSTLRRLRDAKRLDQVGVLLSSHMTNENLFAAKRFFGALAGVRVAFQRPPAGDHDDFLIQADKSPNARGALALGIREDGAVLLKDAAAGKLRMLFVFLQDIVDQLAGAAGTLEQLVFLGSNANRTAELAHVVLPTAVYAEQDGTFTNVDGRVQRCHAALEPLGEARPDWQILGELAAKLSLPLSFTDAPTLFAQMGQSEAPFAGLTYDIVGDQGVLLRT